MNENEADNIAINLERIKSDVASINQHPVSAHSLEFEKIQQQLQQALTNLDGV